MARITVKVVPGSSRDQIVGWLGDALKIKVAAAPEKGRANQAVVKLLAKTLSVSREAIEVVSGHTSPSKVIAIDGLVRSDDADRSRNDLVDWPKQERDGFVFTEINTVADAFPAAFGLMPADRSADVLTWLAGQEMRCSVYAAQYFLDGLFAHGAGKRAVELMLADGNRSWKHMLESGATITWEAWDLRYKPNQDWNHAWGAAPANLLPRYVLGAVPATPGTAGLLFPGQIERDGLHALLHVDREAREHGARIPRRRAEFHLGDLALLDIGGGGRGQFLGDRHAVDADLSPIPRLERGQRERAGSVGQPSRRLATLFGLKEHHRPFERLALQRDHALHRREHGPGRSATNDRHSDGQHPHPSDETSRDIAHEMLLLCA